MAVSSSRTYHFVITFHVDKDHLAFDDPEWAADAACGWLTNEYGLRATYSEPEAVSGDKLLRRRPSSPPGRGLLVT